MTARIALVLTGGLLLGLLLGIGGCSSDEESISTPGPSAQTIGISYLNPMKIEVNSARHWALVLHDRNSPRGTALELVDLENRSVIGTKILDYYDVYDVAFLPNGEGCFTGRIQEGTGYAVQFFTLPSLTLGSRVLTSDTTGAHGYLAVDSVNSCVYYSHAGGGDHDGIYKISITSKTVVDADNDGHAPYAFDNDLVSGFVNGPARLTMDAASRTLMIANTGDNSLTTVDPGLWGTLSRSVSHSFPLSGMSRISTVWPGLSSVRPEMMSRSAEYHILAGTSGTVPFLARFGSNSSSLYSLETASPARWFGTSADVLIHPRDNVVSVFLLQEDSVGVAIGQYGLNNLRPVAGSPYRTRAIADSSISCIGLDLVSDRIIVGDRRAARLELIDIRK
jgi:hypothetical protein